MRLTNTAVYLSRLLGTKVTVNLWPPPTTGPVSETWEIIEKIKEEINVVHELDTGMGPAYARGEFRCRSSEDGKKLAVLKIYKQIPFAGSEGDDPEDRKPQAVEPFEPQELVALKSFKKRDCPIVPELLGYQLTKQSMMTNVPGGCLMYLVWIRSLESPLRTKSSGKLPYPNEPRLDPSSGRHTSIFLKPLLRVAIANSN